MEHTKTPNVGLLLFLLFVAKLWAAITGHTELVQLLIVASLSVILTLNSERRLSAARIARQGFMLITYLALTLVALILMGLKESEWIFLKSLFPWRSLLSFLIDALGAAVLEELIFRKYLLRYLLKKTNRSKAVVLSALIFSGLHYPTIGAVFFSGVFYAIVCLRCNSLLFVIAVHTLYDFLGNMAKSVEKISFNFENGLTPYHVLHGGDVISHFAFMILYLFSILLLNFIAMLKWQKEEKLA